ncbi:MAG: hypothetical protein AB7I27_17255 [Bacteriovoracaceae bacterium]
MKFLFLSITFLSFQAHALEKLVKPIFPACMGVAMMYDEEFKKQQKIWEQSKQCGIDVQVVPRTTFWEAVFSDIGTKNEAQMAINFLTKVGKKAESAIEQNNYYNQVLLNCVRPSIKKDQKEQERCDELVSALKETIRVVRPKLRFNLALSQYKSITLEREEIKPEDNINWKLEEARGTIAPKMESLNGQEMSDVLKAFNRDTKEIDKEWNSFQSPTDEPIQIPAGTTAALMGVQIAPDQEYQNYLMLKRRKKQNEYKARYLELLAQVPILAYMGSANPSNRDIEAAVLRLIDNANKEKDKIKHIFINDKFLATDKTKNAKRAKAMLDFLQYRPVVNEVLYENYSQCGVANGLASYVTKVSLRNNVALVAGMIGVSAFVGIQGGAIIAGAGLSGMSAAALSTIAVLPISGLVYYHDYIKYKASERRVFNVAETFDEGLSIGDINQYSRDRGIVMTNLVLAAIGADLWGGGFIKSGLVFGVTAISSRSLSEASTKIAFRRVLSKQGIREETINNWLKSLSDKDPLKVERTIQEISQEANLSFKEIKLFHTLIGKMAKDFSEKDLKRLQFFMYRLPEEASKRDQIVESSLRIIEKLPPEALAGNQKFEKLRLLVAVTSFGEHNSKKVTSLMKNWNEGLSGLTRTYELAAEKLKDLPASSFSSNAERQRKAYSLALSDLMKEEESFKELSRSEKRAVKDQMIRCGFVL